MTKTKKMLTSTIAALALAGMSSQALAGHSCPRPREAAALKTAAIQQQLMVAALTCQQTHSYNRFVTAYRSDLQRSDAHLRHYFRHHGGMSAYHAYKTKLANRASLRSLHNPRRYCAESRSIFWEAFEHSHEPLIRLVAELPSDSGAGVAGCDMRLAERGDE